MCLSLFQFLLHNQELYNIYFFNFITTTSHFHKTSVMHDMWRHQVAWQPFSNELQWPLFLPLCAYKTLWKHPVVFTAVTSHLYTQKLNYTGYIKPSCSYHLAMGCNGPFIAFMHLQHLIKASHFHFMADSMNRPNDTICTSKYIDI